MKLSNSLRQASKFAANYVHAMFLSSCADRALQLEQHDIHADVVAAHQKFGTDAPSSPVRSLDRSVLESRRKLIEEEFNELMDALEVGCMTWIIAECVDLIYVCVGTLVVMGVPLLPFWRDIHRSNMTKEPAPDGGKWIKTASWSPANPSNVLYEVRRSAR